MLCVNVTRQPEYNHLTTNQIEVAGNILLTLSGHESDLVKHALGGLAIDLEDQGQVDAYGYTLKQCERLITRIRDTQIKYTEKRRNRDA